MHAEQYVRFERTETSRDVRSNVAHIQYQRHAVHHDSIGEHSSILYAEVGSERAEKHRENESTGAKAEFGFEFHSFLKGVAGMRYRLRAARAESPRFEIDGDCGFRRLGRRGKLPQPDRADSRLAKQRMAAPDLDFGDGPVRINRHQENHRAGKMHLPRKLRVGRCRPMDNGTTAVSAAGAKA